MPIHEVERWLAPILNYDRCLSVGSGGVSIRRAIPADAANPCDP
jgi:hypothetical protein